jgi:hypothetical protein
MQKIRVYFGHALTNAPDDYKSERFLARALLEKQPHLEVLRFQGTNAGTPSDVYITDIQKCVGSCHLFICDFTLDSNGTGIEFCEAVRGQGKPTLVLHHRNSRVSRLTTGFEIHHPKLVTIRFYDEICKDLAQLVDEKIEITPELRQMRKLLAAA